MKDNKNGWVETAGKCSLTHPLGVFDLSYTRDGTCSLSFSHAPPDDMKGLITSADWSHDLVSYENQRALATAPHRIADAASFDTLELLVETMLDPMPFIEPIEFFTNNGCEFNAGRWVCSSYSVLLNFDTHHGIWVYKNHDGEYLFWFSVATEARVGQNVVIYSFLPMDADPIQVGLSFLMRHCHE